MLPAGGRRMPDARGHGGLWQGRKRVGMSMCLLPGGLLLHLKLLHLGCQRVSTCHHWRVLGVDIPKVGGGGYKGRCGINAR